MSRPQKTQKSLSAAITGNVTSQKLLDYQGYKNYGDGLETGGRIVLGTATSVDVTVKDSNGKVLCNLTGVTANTDIDPIGAGVVGPLLVTTANISNSAHTLTVYWGIKK